MDEKMEKAWIAATSACVEVIDGEHQYVAPVSPEQWERALNAAFDAARLREPAGVGVVAAQLRRELAEDKGWDYTEYEKGRIAEKERCIAIPEAAPQPPAEALFMADSVHNQAPPGTREGHMVVLETDAVGKPTIWCDPEIVDLVRALNEGGLRTIASCSGHGEKPFGIVTLRDGRELLVLPDYETTRKAERILSEALIPAEAQVQGGGDSTFAEWLASEMPAGTVIGDPAWWADRIARQYAKRSAPPSAPVGVDEAAAIRAFEEHYEANSDDPYFESELELWLTAWRKALATQQPAWRVHDLAARLVDELDGLVFESDGVSGLHLNGDVATWDELLPGGRFERLSSLDELCAALAAQPGGDR